MNLKDKEIKLILDALLFAATPDILLHAVDDQEFTRECVDLAFKINGMTSLEPTERVKLFGVFEDTEVSKSIAKKFPRLEE